MDTVVICGATASGKTALAVAVAKKYGGEVISADSQLVYRQLDIGTAKPTEAEREGIPHHMIDIADPRSEFSASDYERLAFPILEDILRRGKTPVICGGTGFYIQSLLFSRQLGGGPKDEAVREKYRALAAERGPGYVHGLLRECDPESADALHPNDLKRVIRALEIYETTGKRKSEQRDGDTPRVPYRAYAVSWPREELYGRIERRVDAMFAAGLLGEVKGLLAQGIGEGCQCMQAIGYKEICEGLRLGQTEEQMREAVVRNTRRYAKRQLTFFRKFPGLQWIGKDEIP